MNIKLSIITINFNNVDGLKKTMESVFCQSSHEFEYIVIDGGSTDGSKEIISQFANKCKSIPFTWISETDNGVYHAMNKGILKASGEYCQFLNSGDYLVSFDVIERMLSDISDCSIYVGNMLKLLPNGKILRDKGIANNELTMFTFYRGTINHSSAFIKRSLFEKYGMYDESLKIVSDWKFYLITVCFNNEIVKYTDLDITYFDMNGISNNNSTLIKSERRKVLKELLPMNILADYDNHWFDIVQANRIKRYKPIGFLFWFIERAIFKLEKYKILGIK